MENPPHRSIGPMLREAMARRLYRRSVATGEITLPAVPGMIDEYVTMCETLFAGVGRPFTAEQLGHLRSVLEGQLAQAYAASQRSNIVITYNAPVGTVLNYHVNAQWLTIEAIYENWIATCPPPLFGTEPDARVWALANEAADPTTYPVLDIGAGTGRNALALARRGHPVDAVEVTAKFADMIRTDAARELLNMRVIARDVFSTMDDLRQDYQLILLSGVVPEFRTAQELRRLFELAAHCLAPGGRLVFNTFLAHDWYTLDNATRELAEQCYSSVFTRHEMSSAAGQLPLELVADDSVFEYEKAHLPEGAWPPTGWFAEWSSGQDVFDVEREQSPMELRWLVYQKTLWGGTQPRLVSVSIEGLG
jgi:SAM-dependent methyltransferase